MAAKKKQITWTPTQIKEHIQNIEKAATKLKRENKGEHFTSMTPDEIKQKLKRVNSPMILGQVWNSTTPGGVVNYEVGIYNPDPIQATNLFAHVWVGSGNVDPNVGTFLLNVDTRFPRLTQPAFFGLTLAPLASTKLSFSLKIPAGIEKTNYLTNVCLMQFNWHDIGKYLDRSIFIFAVT